jgi:hypothetical protein
VKTDTVVFGKKSIKLTGQSHLFVWQIPAGTI